MVEVEIVLSLKERVDLEKEEREKIDKVGQVCQIVENFIFRGF